MKYSPMLDYEDIAGHMKQARVVGIGESTHGTHEFFQTKVELCKILVEKHGFNTIFFESVDDVCEAINSYICNGSGDPVALVNRLFYVYRTYEVLELIQWLRAHYAKYPVEFVGLDGHKYIDDYAVDYSMDASNRRDRRMANVIHHYVSSRPHAKCLVWAHDFHVAAYVNAPLSYKDQYAPMGRHLRRWFKKDYFCVCQLFGEGSFSSEIIDEQTGLSEKGILHELSTPPVTDDFWEYRLMRKYKRPVFLSGPTFGGIAEAHEIHKLRSLGWGVMQSKIHEAYTWVDMYHAYDAIIFYPKSTSSHMLR